MPEDLQDISFQS